MAIDTAILIIGIVVEAIVCGLLLKKGIWRTLPFFTIYVAWTIVSDTASSLILWKFPGSYNHYYVWQVVADALLQFSVLVELAWSALKPVRPSLPKGSLLLLVGVTAAAGLLVWPLAGMSVPSNWTGLNITLFKLQEATSLLRVACFVLMASFSQLISIGWRDRELQVATGLGFYSIISLIVTMLHSHQSSGPQYHWPDQALALCYFCTLFYWMYSFSTKAQERKEFSPQMQHLLLQMGGGARSGRMALTNLPRDRFQSKD